MSIGPIQLIIVLVIVIAIFGTKKLGNLGADLGTAIKGFKNAIKEDESPAENAKPVEKIAAQSTEKPVIEGEVTREKDSSKQG